MMGRAFLVSLVALQFLAAPAAAQAAPDDCDPEKGNFQPGVSWAQQRMDVRRVWPLTRGDGVKVAVIDSGVDLTHPQIPVSGKADLTGKGYRDCVGHGTAVAGIIAARDMKGVAFHGMAPNVSLMSFKQSHDGKGELSLLVKGIKAAADLGAEVINISIQAEHHPALKAAVDYALAKDAVIVAAAGNIRKEDRTESAAYPAAYEGVLAVGAANKQGVRSDFSNSKTPVAVLGPGQEITATWPGKSYQADLNGTSFAVPYVTGVAALVRARFPHLNQEQVRRRVIATAEGSTGKGTGAGMVNPMLAVTMVLPYEPVNAPVVAPPPPAPMGRDAVAKAPPVDHDAIAKAGIIAGVATLLVILVITARVFMPMSRRRARGPV
ncbi:S8 family serine peptidase [Nonomuraea endophytica]|uniref:Type VII secretion-associated serine protease mycosin n=1 Tax=Nonomuraea endophytica TaxID=714136 RepID=A0A7W7ZW43_9ACTN|nr:S8 family serine peptidase [Nonomuraea endophytica]MBB5074880.1 type VII secretion-associated serine protease mycosin [Nonomuraea endophytica]